MAGGSPSDPSLPRGHAVAPASVIVHFDGACQPARGGGIATYGFVVEGAGLRHEAAELAVPPGAAHATNNVAEYVAAARALEWLLARGYRGPVVLFGDSELVIRQMNGEYAVRTAHLHAYHDHLRELAKRFERVSFAWVPREQNALADALSKEALAREWQRRGRAR